MKTQQPKERETIMKRRNRSAQAQVSAPPKADEVATIMKLKTPQPTHEQIQRRAYEIFQARGDAPGTELSDWLQAEHELKAGLSEVPERTVGEISKPTPPRG